MLKYLTVEFPLTKSSVQRIGEFRWKQRRYEHDTGVIRFVDWNPDPSVITPGSPVKVTVTLKGVSKIHYAYVNYVKHHRAYDKNYVDVHLISASYVMKQANQEVYANVTASMVAALIAKKHGFSYDIAPHDRVFAQISNPGYTDWQILAKLAKQIGYTLRSEGTVLIFKPIIEDYVRQGKYAKQFLSTTPGAIIPPSLYEIHPIVGDSIEYADGYKAAVAVSGYDSHAGGRFTAVNKNKSDYLRARSTSDFFDRYDTRTTVPTLSDAKYEAKAVEELNRFPYRATAVLVGTPDLRPDMPIKISGVNKDLDGNWIVIESEHVVERGMYTTRVEIGLDSLGATTQPKQIADTQKYVVPTPRLKVFSPSVLPSKSTRLSKVSNRLSEDKMATKAIWEGSSIDLRSRNSASAKASQAVLG